MEGWRFLDCLAYVGPEGLGRGYHLIEDTWELFLLENQGVLQAAGPSRD